MSLLSGPYTPADVERQGPFVVIEGVSGVGKSTLTRAVAEQLGAVTLHTLPEPMTRLSSAVNREARALPQFAFYLSGALHASDVISEGLAKGPVVADRYLSSVIACHAAVNGVPVEAVRRLVAPFASYFTVPDHTFYLLCSEKTLRARMKNKSDLKEDDTALFDVPGRLSTLLRNFAAVAAEDPTGVVLDTDDQTPEELAATIVTTLEISRA
ncbi:AAA family ATPase [Streptomyces finlayi]|uniref:AAA family ATPase n=1 Tax=Streptomyces finlayi TaxID=67296 RepID=A0A7G7BH31_9ACTN|nr:AAA family ATPase [Streptomyces finlayi]QNE74646.1 AAA family ATPase [Streptomyces finlayi]